jgi:hypothetical protein
MYDWLGMDAYTVHMLEAVYLHIACMVHVCAGTGTGAGGSILCACILVLDLADVLGRLHAVWRRLLKHVCATV